MKQIPGQLQGQAAGQLYGLKEGEHRGTQDIENIIYAWQVCVQTNKKKIQLESFPRYPLPPHQKAVHHVVHRKVIAARVSGPI